MEILLCDGFPLEVNHFEKQHAGLHGHLYDPGDLFPIHDVVVSTQSSWTFKRKLGFDEEAHFENPKISLEISFPSEQVTFEHSQKT